MSARANAEDFDYSILLANRMPRPKSGGCSWCHKRGSSSLPLKRCAGCSVDLYCSKDCQVAAWPSHKLECRESQGDPSCGLTKAYQKWTEVHQLSLHAIPHALIRATGGIEFNLMNSRTLLITLIPHRATWEKGNPAKAFSIADATIFDKDDNVYARAEWIGDRARAREEALREILEGGEGADIVGVFPVTYFVVNERATMHDLCPIRRREEREELDAGHEEFLAHAYGDLARLSVRCVNDGIVFRDPKNQRANKWLPHVGRYTRPRKGAGWRWERFEAARAWNYLNAVLGEPETDTNVAGFTAEELWKFWGLWY